MTAPAVPTSGTCLDEKSAQRADSVITLLADRLADPGHVAAIVSRPDNHELTRGMSMWSPASLSHGFPGIALFYGELARHDDAWRGVAHQHIMAAAEEMHGGTSAGLHAGPASLLAAAQTCAGPEGHYARLRERLTRWLASQHSAHLAAVRDREEPGVAWTDYDIIHGLGGTTRILIDAAADSGAPGAGDAAEAVEATLRHLVRMTVPLTVGGQEVPGWWVPNHLEPVEQDRRDYPRGDFNLGLAHGAAGPLAVLSQALDRGLEVPGQRDAIHRIANWIIGWTMHDQAGTYWPCRVSWEEQTAACRPPASFTRTAWCYGAPGIAAALHQAGRAVGYAAWEAAAVDSLRSAVRRGPSSWRLDGATVCHGYGGLLQVLWRVGTASRDSQLITACADVASLALDQADPDAPFLFRHLVPDSPEGWRTATGYRPLDGAGILEGAAGVGCALISVLRPHLISHGRQEPARSPSWDRCLALS